MLLKSMTIAAAIVLAGPAGSPPAKAQPDAPATVQAFRDALRAGDREQALELLAPEVVIFESGGAEMSREEYAGHHLPADIEFSRAVRSETVARQDGRTGDSAWVLTRYRTRGTFRDKPIDSEEAETMILRSTASGWRIVHIHWSSHRAAAP